MGLYDGSIDSTGLGSTAHLAKILNTPVILLINANKRTDQTYAKYFIQGQGGH